MRGSKFKLGIARLDQLSEDKPQTGHISRPLSLGKYTKVTMEVALSREPRQCGAHPGWQEICRQKSGPSQR